MKRIKSLLLKEMFSQHFNNKYYIRGCYWVHFGGKKTISIVNSNKNL